MTSRALLPTAWWHYSYEPEQADYISLARVLNKLTTLVFWHN